MQLLAHLPLLSLLATATTGLQHLQYDLPDELLALFGPAAPLSAPSGASAPTSVPSSGTASAASSPGSSSGSSLSSSSPNSTTQAASCYYPAAFTLNDFTTWTPAVNSSVSYVSFVYADNGTSITTPCSYNATSKSLTAGTGLAARYACDNQVISFIWQKGKITAIETTCPGQTTTKFEASGSVLPAGLQCSATNGTGKAGLGQGAGTLCKAAGPLTANFTSQEPSPLQN